MTICSIFSRCLIVTSISQQRQQDGASIERPHLFHWPSPSLPLSIPIFSSGRPRILRFPCEIRVTNALHGRYFPLAIPIKSRQGPHLVKTTHSRASSHRSDKTAPLSLWEMRAGAGAPAIFSEVELPLNGVLRSSRRVLTDGILCAGGKRPPASDLRAGERESRAHALHDHVPHSGGAGK